MKPSLHRRPDGRCLVFSPLAWLKLQYLCHLGPTEIGAFAISAPEHPLYVTQLMTVPQRTTITSVEFDDQAVADYFDHSVDQGLRPGQFARIWVHCHPGASALPSGTDEETFRRVFGSTDWAVMAILSREGHSYARLQLNAGPGASCRLRCRVDWKSWPQAFAEESLSDCQEAWCQEYQQHVHPQSFADCLNPEPFPPPDHSDEPYRFPELESWLDDPVWALLRRYR